MFALDIIASNILGLNFYCTDGRSHERAVAIGFRAAGHATFPGNARHYRFKPIRRDHFIAHNRDRLVRTESLLNIVRDPISWMCHCFDHESSIYTNPIVSAIDR